MILKFTAGLAKCLCISLIIFSFAGCKDKAEKAVQEKGPDSKPIVTLTNIKVQNDPGMSQIKVIIATSGTFGYSVVPKSDPERIIAVIHNAKLGDVPNKTEVNDGTINKIETVQLDTGRGPAVRITIGLDRKTPHEPMPADGVLVIAMPKK